MRRRQFISFVGGAAAWPLAVYAQQPTEMRRIAVIVGVADDPQGQARLAAFTDGMRALGWTDGRNVHFEIRFSGGSPDRARSDAADMVGIAPDVIVANGAAVIRALQQLTKTIPVVFAQVVDPVSSGFVESLARPGGNMTGFTSVDYRGGRRRARQLVSPPRHPILLRTRQRPQSERKRRTRQLVSPPRHPILF
jgi:putative tryptophan/tyrosine transport system substrate-binding protein